MLGTLNAPVHPPSWTAEFKENADRHLRRALRVGIQLVFDKETQRKLMVVSPIAWFARFPAGVHRRT